MFEKENEEKVGLNSFHLRTAHWCDYKRKKYGQTWMKKN